MLEMVKQAPSSYSMIIWLHWGVRGNGQITSKLSITTKTVEMCSLLFTLTLNILSLAFFFYISIFTAQSDMMVNIFNWDYAWGSIQTEGSKRSERLGCSIAQLWTCFIWQLYLFFFNSNLHNSVLKYSSRFQADLIEPSLKMTDTSRSGAPYKWRANTRGQLLEIKHVNTLNARSPSVRVSLTMQLLCDSCRRDQTGGVNDTRNGIHLASQPFFFREALV